MILAASGATRPLVAKLLGSRQLGLIVLLNGAI